MKNRILRLIAVFLATTVLAAAALPQLKEVLKVVGVGAAVKQFGPEIDKAINRLAKYNPPQGIATKVVPILSIGINKSSAIGAAQVVGPKAKIQTVEAVAQPEADLFGHEVRIRALIPVSSKDVIRDIRRVDGVGVSGIVDLKL